MAGSSGKPVVQKLGLKPGFRIFVEGAPAAYPALVGELPEGVTLAAQLRGAIDMIHVFATEADVLARRLPAYRAAIKPDGMIWISWPKQAAGVETDLSDTVIRKLVLSLGLVDVKVCAIDATWSGLKVVIPKAQRG